jgi:hypothetical protein
MAAGTGRETRLSTLFPMLVTTTHGVCLCCRRGGQIRRMVYAVLFSLLRNELWPYAIASVTVVDVAASQSKAALHDGCAIAYTDSLHM